MATPSSEKQHVRRERDAEFSLRPAGRADDPVVWEMLKPVFREGQTYAIDPGISRADALEYWFGGKDGVWLLLDRDGPVGTFYLRPNAAGGGSHICNCGFVTAGEAQGRGIARRMLAEAERLAREKDYRAMQFNFVIESNARAVDLWSRAGFAIIGRIPDGYRQPGIGYVDALIMHKRLPEDAA
jgi:ribosomal protein S18 acetylase RimI-like enzyme